METPGYPWVGVRVAASWGGKVALNAILARRELMAKISADSSVDRIGVFAVPSASSTCVARTRPCGHPGAETLWSPPAWRGMLLGVC
ncbi:hypothetical protein [Streptomyces sp. NPDC007172]|uniref:hypothetical protein n=1 Tax=Streptomyces sp. NPDC007172 TaxID=3364776 RepID=UPI00369330F0